MQAYTSKESGRKKSHLHAGLILLALITLLNPNINVIDILPDFIGYLILYFTLAHAAARAPFFDEARRGFLHLAFISFLRIPGFLLMTWMRGVNTSDNDSIPLFTLVFAVVEIIVALGAAKNLFAALSYLGERTATESIIGTDPTSDFLAKLTAVFIFLKCGLGLLPELLLLTVTNGAGTLASSQSAVRFYPAALIFCQLVAYTAGIVWFAFCYRYLKNLKHEDGLYRAAMFLSDGEREKEISYNQKLEKIRTGLKLLPVAAFLSLEFTLKNLGGVNILPHFILGFSLLLILLRLRVPHSRISNFTLGAGVLYTAFAIAAWAVSIAFSSKYVYAEIITTEAAASLYLAVEITFLVEGIFLVAFLALFALSVCEFIKTHTGKTPRGVVDALDLEPNTSEPYSIYDADVHRSLVTRTWIFAAFGIAGAVAKVVNVFLRGSRVFEDGVLVPGVAPWFGVVVLAIAIVWGVYSLNYSATVLEEFNGKYEKYSHYFSKRA